MKRAEFQEHVGPRNICSNVEQALARAREILRGEAGAGAR